MSMTLQTSRYETLFQQCRSENRHAFIPFTLLGYPNQTESLKIIQDLIEAGASALELGLAFSDPMADGPIIQQAAKETLEAGVTVNDALQLLKEIRTFAPEIPIGLLVYYNMVLARGIERFFQEISEVGVDGMLIADLPPENMEEVAPFAHKNQIQLITIVSPLTSNERLQLITKYAGGFLYVVSRLGITGVEETFDQQLNIFLKRLKTQTDLPLCVGFGISKPEHAQKMIQAGADGVITGSRVIQLIQETPKEKRTDSLQNFVKFMSAVCESSSMANR